MYSVRTHRSHTICIPIPFHTIGFPSLLCTRIRMQIRPNLIPPSNHMGSLFSLPAAAIAPSQEPGLGDLPESCVALVLGHLEPLQICRLATLNRAFRGASSADIVWESKLPVNYEDLLARVFERENASFCKRDIYARFCKANSFDGGSKVFELDSNLFIITICYLIFGELNLNGVYWYLQKVWVDKRSGNICMSVSSNGLTINGIDDRRYWSRIPSVESRWGLVSFAFSKFGEFWFILTQNIEFKILFFGLYF